MYRIASVFLAVMFLEFGAGVFAGAQTTCPDLSGEWTFELSSIQHCKVDIAVPGVTPPAGPYYPVNKSGTWTFHPVGPDKCMFWAERVVTASNLPKFIGDYTYFTGVIHADRRTVTMELRPDADNNPGTLYGKITGFDRRTGLPTQIGFAGSLFLGAQDTNVSCAISARGLIQK